MLGTTDYVSPEQALGQPVTGQSDLYSLGIVLYEMLTGEVPFKGENQVAVAMKHVREEMPDVPGQAPRGLRGARGGRRHAPPPSDPEDRYADDAELIADLEDVLAIETARAGSADRRGHDGAPHAARPEAAPGPVPASPPGDRDPGGADRRRRCSAVARSGWGRAPTTAPGAQHAAAAAGADPGAPVSDCAYGFNPLGNPTDEHPDASLAIDNQPGTSWNTQTYYDDTLDKAGVGLYVDANPGTTARVLRVTTATPGFTATVYARDTKPPLRWPDPGWAQISAPTNDRRQARHQADERHDPVPLLPACGSPASAATAAWRSTS